MGSGAASEAPSAPGGGSAALRLALIAVTCFLLGAFAGAAILTTNTDNSRATHTWQPGQLGGAQAAGAGRDIAFASPQQSDGSSSSSKTTATILMPSHMAHLGVNRPLAKEVRRHTVGPSGGTQPWPVPLAGRRSALDRDVLALHWVITSCDRHQWGRMASHALLSGLLNGLKPATMSIVWCRPFPKDDPSKVPSLLRNLRLSHSVNILFPNEQLYKEGSGINAVEATLLTAFMVPKVLGAPQLPLFMMEDDVMVAPDANLRLRAAYHQVPELYRNFPVLIKCYQGGEIEPAPERAQGLRQRADDPAWEARATGRPQDVAIEPNINFGSQANFFSPSMTALILYEMLEFIKPNATHQGHLQDMHILVLLRDKYNCNRLASACWYYTMRPSLVQHIGTSSTLFGKLNTRFHYDEAFPMSVVMPGYDAEGTWRRRGRRRAGQRRRVVK